jgi:hypothetical protein
LPYERQPRAVILQVSEKFVFFPKCLQEVADDGNDQSAHATKKGSKACNILKFLALYEVRTVEGMGSGQRGKRIYDFCCLFGPMRVQ